MFLKPPKIREFTYRPIFYKPPEEEEEQGPRIKFRRYWLSNPPKQRSFIVMVFLIVILIFLLIYWQGLEKSDQKEFKFEDVKIEEIR